MSRNLILFKLASFIAVMIAIYLVFICVLAGLLSIASFVSWMQYPFELLGTIFFTWNKGSCLSMVVSLICGVVVAGTRDESDLKSGKLV